MQSHGEVKETNGNLKDDSVSTATVRAGTHYPTCRVQSTRHVGHASRNVCDNRNGRGVLAREPTRAPRDVSRVTEE
jgi:hypothetical protein